MNKLYIYLIYSQNRLIMTKKQYDDSNYLKLTTFESFNDALLLTAAKSFCNGYIVGRNINIDVINDIDEFKL